MPLLPDVSSDSNILMLRMLSRKLTLMSMTYMLSQPEVLIIRRISLVHSYTNSRKLYMVLNKLHGCGNINWRNFFPNLDLSALQQTHVSSYMKTTKAHLYAGRGDCARDQGVRGSKSDRLPSSRVEGSSTIDRQAGRCGRGRLQQGGEGDRVSASGRRVSEERVSSPRGAQGGRASHCSAGDHSRSRKGAHGRCSPPLQRGSRDAIFRV